MKKKLDGKKFGIFRGRKSGENSRFFEKKNNKIVEKIKIKQKFSSDEVQKIAKSRHFRIKRKEKKQQIFYRAFYFERIYII